jgi:hypothetical protein
MSFRRGHVRGMACWRCQTSVDFHASGENRSVNRKTSSSSSLTIYDVGYLSLSLIAKSQNADPIKHKNQSSQDVSEISSPPHLPGSHKNALVIRHQS